MTFALICRWIVAAAASLVLLACGTTSAPSDSPLRKAFDERSVGRTTAVTFVSDTVLKVILLGTPEREAVDAVLRAGLSGGDTRFSGSPQDPRCGIESNPGAPRLPCPDPAGKSDYYLVFGAKADYRGSLWTEYHMQLGIHGGVVDFVYADIRNGCWLCP